MRIVSTNDFRDNLASYLDSVAKNETPLVVRRFGKPLVVVSPFKKGETDNYKKFYGFLAGDESGVDFENRIRRSKKEKEYVKRLRKGNG